MKSCHGVSHGATIQHSESSHRSPNDGMTTQMIFPDISGCFARSTAACVVITWVRKRHYMSNVVLVRAGSHRPYGMAHAEGMMVGPYRSIYARISPK